MLLRLKQRVKVPEGRLDPLVGGHFFKSDIKKRRNTRDKTAATRRDMHGKKGTPHFKENAAQLRANFEQRMQGAENWHPGTHGFPVVLLERLVLPVAAEKENTEKSENKNAQT